MVEKRVKKFGQGSPPPPFSGNAQKKTFFFSGGLPLGGGILDKNIFDGKEMIIIKWATMIQDNHLD